MKKEEELKFLEKPKISKKKKNLIKKKLGGGRRKR